TPRQECLGHRCRSSRSSRRRCNTRAPPFRTDVCTETRGAARRRGDTETRRHESRGAAAIAGRLGSRGRLYCSKVFTTWLLLEPLVNAIPILPFLGEERQPLGSLGQKH